MRPRSPGWVGSRRRSPPIARHSSRETYRPRPLPSSGRSSVPRTNRPKSRRGPPRRRPGPLVGDRQPERGGGRVHGDRRPTGDRAAVLDGVVEQRPQDLVELVGVGDGEPALGVVRQLERARRPSPSASQALRTRVASDRTSARGSEGPRLEPGHGQQLADHPRQPLGLLGDDPEAPVRTVLVRAGRRRPGCWSAASGGCG